MSQWIAYYLKAPDEESARQAARDADVGLLYIDEQGVERWSPYSATLGTAFDPDVTVWITKPVHDAEGAVVDAGELEAGWFANLHVRSDMTADAQALIAAAAGHGVEIRNPETPERVWA